ncbi:MAG: hypothetical protein IKD55_06550 [Sediminibacterium sp.]|nr:hypothetical protein [Sediminibacterium sp.]
MKKKIIFLASGLAFILLSVILLSWKTTKNVSQKENDAKTVLVKKKPNYDYDRGYNKGYSYGSSGLTTLFQGQYSNALNADQFDYADGLLDGFNAGKSGGSSAPGGGGPVSIDPTTGCKYVINDQALVNYLNSLGFGCYVNFN